MERIASDGVLKQIPIMLLGDKNRRIPNYWSGFAACRGCNSQVLVNAIYGIPPKEMLEVYKGLAPVRCLF